MSSQKDSLNDLGGLLILDVHCTCAILEIIPESVIMICKVYKISLKKSVMQLIVNQKS